MNWTDQGIVLAARRHGETSAIASLLTRAHGRHAGLVRGGWGKRARALLQPGNAVQACWRGRLAEHLGTFVVEPGVMSAGALFNDPLRLAALASACVLADAALPEREAHPAVHDALAELIRALTQDQPGWPEAYVRWEVRLLADLGFGLDLTRCAATGVQSGLAYVSPNTGRAVSTDGAGPWRDRLLALPAFLAGANESRAAVESIAQGLTLTGHFLARHVFAPHGRALPAARQRLDRRIAASVRAGAD